MTSILKVTEVQDPTNSNTALSIDSSGRVSRPVIPYAFVTFAASNSYVSKAANAILDFSVAVVNNGSHFNTSTYKFTCPVAGLYQVEIATLTQNNSDAYGIFPVRNSGGTEAKLTRFYTNARAIAGASFTIECSANDELYFKPEHTKNFYSSTVDSSHVPYNWATFRFIG